MKNYLFVGPLIWTLDDRDYWDMSYDEGNYDNFYIEIPSELGKELSNGNRFWFSRELFEKLADLFYNYSLGGKKEELLELITNGRVFLNENPVNEESSSALLKMIFSAVLNDTREVKECENVREVILNNESDHFTKQELRDIFNAFTYTENFRAGAFLSNNSGILGYQIDIVISDTCIDLFKDRKIFVLDIENKEDINKLRDFEIEYLSKVFGYIENV
jgi:hypothetical protein